MTDSTRCDPPERGSGTATDPLAGGVPPEETGRLAALAEYGLPAEHTEGGLSSLAEIAARLCDVSCCAITIVTATEQHTIAGAGTPTPTACRRDDALGTVVLGLGRTVIVPDTRNDPRFAGNPYVTGRLGTVRFYASRPLWGTTGHVLGALCLTDERVRELRADQVWAFERIADQVSEIFELRRRSRLLSQVVAELRRSHDNLAAFAGQISHDLRIPLTSMAGFIELLADNPTVLADPTARRYVARSLGSAGRMRMLIDGILDYVRAGGGLHRELVDLRTLMADVVDDLDTLITSSGATVSVQDAKILADPVQVRVLLQNLVANGITYARPGVPPVVQVAAGESAPHELDGTRTAADITASRLWVLDNGRGIPEAQRAGVIQPLVRLSRDVPGSGLGLATCTRIAEAHGGWLKVLDAPGGGTTISVWLPAPGS